MPVTALSGAPVSPLTTTGRALLLGEQMLDEHPVPTASMRWKDSGAPCSQVQEPSSACSKLPSR